MLDDLNEPNSFAKEAALDQSVHSDELPNGSYYIHEKIAEPKDSIEIIKETTIGACPEEITVYKIKYHDSGKVFKSLYEYKSRDLLASLPKGNPKITEYLRIERQLVQMSFARGESISHLLKDERLSIDDRESAIRAVCETILELHKSGFCHTDLSMDNIKLERQANGKFIANLCDFEYAKRIGTDIYAGEKEAKSDFRGLFSCIANLVYWKDVYTLSHDKGMQFEKILRRRFIKLESKHDIDLICERAKEEMLNKEKNN